ncbi:uncharacterized protein LOC118413850 isoform X2 [Branchiostoma floridae]|uniref:Uncharacterized protein LOC118413850 isoform X2 n=1 Tax=Branchiostoma floridae TaxID=7739 RepID=A0A9J7KZE9_BRAFL|nr:uncharacterized protein LOC118413850 isoform X2 [Branchiostoma floridae]
MASTHVWVCLCFFLLFSPGKCQQQNIKECYTRSKTAVRYDGLLDVSKSGHSCLPWSETELPYVGNHSYCRAPRPQDLQPWCYIQGRVSRLDVPCAVEHCKDSAHLGCFRLDKPPTEVLTAALPVAQDTMTVDRCLEICRTGLQDYAGLSGGNKCYCIFYAKQRLPEADDCSKPCKGNGEQKCGGDSSIDIYDAVASCPTPTIPNGSLTLDRRPDRALFKPGEEVNFTFSCDAGYRKCRKKRKSATCKNSGSWSRLPECRPEHYDTCGDAQISTETPSTSRQASTAGPESSTTTQWADLKTTQPYTAETTLGTSTILDRVTTVRWESSRMTTRISSSSPHTSFASPDPVGTTVKHVEPNLSEGQKQGVNQNMIIVASAVTGCILLAVGVVTCVVISKRKARARKRRRLTAAPRGQSTDNAVVDDVLTYNFRTLANTAQIRLQIISTVEGAGSDPSDQSPDAGYATASMTKKKMLPDPPGDEAMYQNAVMFNTAERASTKKDPSNAPAIYTKVKKNKRQVDSPGSTLGSQTAKSERDFDTREAKVRPEPCPRTSALYAKVNKKRPPEPLPWELEELREPDPEVTYPELDHVQCHVAEVTEFLPEVTASHSEGVYAEIRDIMVQNSRESSSDDSYNAYDKAAYGYSSSE